MGQRIFLERLESGEAKTGVQKSGELTLDPSLNSVPLRNLSSFPTGDGQGMNDREEVGIVTSLLLITMIIQL